jgi:hypothetical protein
MRSFSFVPNWIIVDLCFIKKSSSFFCSWFSSSILDISLQFDIVAETDDEQL